MVSQTPERQDRRREDRWTPPVTSIRDVRHIIALDLVLLLILLGTLFLVVPGTVRAVTGQSMFDTLQTPVHVGPALAIAVAAAIALLSLASGAAAVAGGHPMILRGVSSASGRFARRSLHAALLVGTVGLVQLALFGLYLPGVAAG